MGEDAWKASGIPQNLPRHIEDIQNDLEKAEANVTELAAELKAARAHAFQVWWAKFQHACKLESRR